MSTLAAPALSGALSATEVADDAITVLKANSKEIVFVMRFPLIHLHCGGMVRKDGPGQMKINLCTVKSNSLDFQSCCGVLMTDAIQCAGGLEPGCITKIATSLRRHRVHFTTVKVACHFLETGMPPKSNGPCSGLPPILRTYRALSLSGS